METVQTREQWMLAGIDALRPHFDAAGVTIPAHVRISTGWPGGKGTKAKTIGQCWASATVSDGTSAIFISPVLKDPVTILVTIVHELVHAVDDCKSGHRGAFVKMAKAVGLMKPWTSTPPTPELVEVLKGIAAGLGEFDHGSISTSARKGVQGTRMLKVECLTCGCVIRMTRKWLNEAGLPTCGCGSEMEES
jgi:hypothetical protein